MATDAVETEHSVRTANDQQPVHKTSSRPTSNDKASLSSQGRCDGCYCCFCSCWFSLCQCGFQSRLCLFRRHCIRPKTHQLSSKSNSSSSRIHQTALRHFCLLTPQSVAYIAPACENNGEDETEERKNWNLPSENRWDGLANRECHHRGPPMYLASGVGGDWGQLYQRVTDAGCLLITWILRHSNAPIGRWRRCVGFKYGDTAGVIDQMRVTLVAWGATCTVACTLSQRPEQL